MSDTRTKIERLITLTERLTGMLSEDVSALEKGKASVLNSTQNSFQQLLQIYIREAGSFDPASATAAPAELRQKLTQSAKKMNDLLALHQRMITRVRNASEGMIKAIAKEVERRKTAHHGYTRAPAARPRSSGAMVYNSVI